jgi:transglutaminase-like putative cysteine protease
LLRANNIPAGLCYQRLILDKNSFCLHGLNAVHLENYGWYRIDPRGNYNDIKASFSPPHEKLAFKINDKLEADFTEIWYEPIKIVTDILTSKKTFLEVSQSLPDLQIIRP